MEPILRTEHLTFTYPGEERPTLGDLSLEIARGSFVAVLGHNGSGKSTLAKHFNAILLPTGGKVYVDGMDTSDENNLLAVRATVGMDKASAASRLSIPEKWATISSPCLLACITLTLCMSGKSSHQSFTLSIASASAE